MLLGTLASCAEPSRATSTPAADAVIALDPYFRDLRVVHALAGGDTLTLLLDTGGGATLLTPDKAREHGCTPRGSDVGHRMSGEVVIFARCDSLRIAAGGFSTLVAPVAVFDVNALLPKELPRLDGVLALDAFCGRVLTIDWPRGEIIVHDSSTADSAARGALPYRAATGMSGRFYSVFVAVDGRRGTLWFLLDSGNLRGTLVSPAVLSDSLLAPGPNGQVDLQIGGRLYGALNVTSAGLAIDGALGTSFLQLGAVTLDLRTPTLSR